MTTIGSAMEWQRDELIESLRSEGVSEEVIEEFSSFADHWHYQLSELAASGRAMERLMDECGFDWKSRMNRYIALHMEESIRFAGDYLSESERRELEEALDAIRDGACDD